MLAATALRAFEAGSSSDRTLNPARASMSAKDWVVVLVVIFGYRTRCAASLYVVADKSAVPDASENADEGDARKLGVDDDGEDKSG